MENIVSRGIRNKNPFNIEWSRSNTWLGQRGSDGRFCIFDTIDHGVRAGLLLLMNYYTKYRLDTPFLVLHRFCPDGTIGSYLENIRVLSGYELDSDTKLNSLYYWLLLAHQMLLVESGYNLSIIDLYHVYGSLPKNKRPFPLDWDSIKFT